MLNTLTHIHTLMYILIHKNRNGLKLSVFIMFVLLFLTVQNWNSFSLSWIVWARIGIPIFISHTKFNIHIHTYVLCIYAVFILCVYIRFSISCAQKNLHKPNKLIQFAACTEHDREYTFHYFEFVWFKSLFFPLLLSASSLAVINYSYTYTPTPLHAHTRSCGCWC